MRSKCQHSNQKAKPFGAPEDSSLLSANSKGSIFASKQKAARLLFCAKLAFAH
jgi:hypothetical protein